MGIKLLNTFLKKKCCKQISNISLNDLYNKKICIDISIYIYKYLSTDTLIENIYLLCSILKKYKIKPIFIFDGKYSVFKQKHIEERRKQREESIIKYNKILENNDIKIYQKK